MSKSEQTNDSPQPAMHEAKWQEEIEEMHDLFQAYFAGTADSLERVNVALADDFTIIGPRGDESNRAETMQALQGAHGQAPDLRIATTDHRLLATTSDMIVARYVEHHHQGDTSTQRSSTVVFTRGAAGPNGLSWRTVHETWLPTAPK